eukprot:CAMPEP_0113651524 /NCGR_PEP_ID=MMETSP0017_2-20120614/27470_1 /TAXON_ID=2856 /ORGANISM="Cylindrotheca closterium" /LENGTH=880 /DNA_ID=CAMNT_0000564213 /DNA_START=102 /DNA_END=2744 /DNA_ORIENTATION=- /assembly_acc=CAM_ASM_000147
MESQLLRERAARDAARESLLREAAFREARAAEAASALASSRPLGGLPPSSFLGGARAGLGATGLGAAGLGAGGLGSLDYASLAATRTGLYPPSSAASAALPLHLRGPASSIGAAGFLPPPPPPPPPPRRASAAAAAGGRLPLSAAAIRQEAAVTREHALRSIAHEEAILAATREQARRNLAHEEAIMAASREHAIRNLAHEEAILAATREQARRNLAHEEALLAATREQGRRNLLAQNAGTIAAATNRGEQVTTRPNMPLSWGAEALPLAATREYSRREIVHDSVEEEAIFEGKKLRSGKLTQQEEIYGDILIELFDKGQVDVERGVMLRTFLAKALHCSPLRVTKNIYNKGGEPSRVYMGRKYLPVLDPEFQQYNGRFQTARENFLKVLKHEWEMEEASDEAASDEEGKSSGGPMERIKDKLWNKRVRQLAEFYQEYGVANLPIQKKFRELRDFVHRVRIQYRKKQLSEERIEQLEDLGFIWSFRRFVPWKTRLEELRAFRQRHGHCRVPFRYKENPSFGLWAANMRARYARFVKGKDSTVAPIATEQIEALNELGFAWELSSSANRSQNGNFQFQPNPRQQMVSAAQQQTNQFLMGKSSMVKAARLKSSYWDELYVKVEANLRALDRLYKQEEASEDLESAGRVGAYVANCPPMAPRTGLRLPMHNNNYNHNYNNSNRVEYISSDDETIEEMSIGSEPSMSEWSFGDIDDDDYRKVESNLRALDQWYNEEAALEAAEKEKQILREEQFASADDDDEEEEKKKSPARGEPASTSEEWKNRLKVPPSADSQDDDETTDESSVIEIVAGPEKKHQAKKPAYADSEDASSSSSTDDEDSIQVIEPPAKQVKISPEEQFASADEEKKSPTTKEDDSTDDGEWL